MKENFDYFIRLIPLSSRNSRRGQEARAGEFLKGAVSMEPNDR